MAPMRVRGPGPAEIVYERERERERERESLKGLTLVCEHNQGAYACV